MRDGNLLGPGAHVYKSSNVQRLAEQIRFIRRIVGAKGMYQQVKMLVVDLDTEASRKCVGLLTLLVKLAEPNLQLHWVIKPKACLFHSSAVSYLFHLLHI